MTSHISHILVKSLGRVWEITVSMGLAWPAPLAVVICREGEPGTDDVPKLGVEGRERVL